MATAEVLHTQTVDIGTSEHANGLLAFTEKHLAEGRRASVTPTEQKRLLDALIHAAQKGNLTKLEIFLAKDVTPMRMVEARRWEGIAFARI